MKTSKKISSAVYQSPDVETFVLGADVSLLSSSPTGGTEQYNEYQFDWTTEA